MASNYNEQSVHGLVEADEQFRTENGRSSPSQDSIDSLGSRIRDINLQSRESSPDKLFSSRESCRNGKKCFRFDCWLDHPPGWSACEDGKDCDNYDCEANHPFGRKGPCRNKLSCRKRDCGCEFLHPIPEKDKCLDKDQCRKWKCTKWHPKSRPKDCPFGQQCYNPACKLVHPPERNVCPTGVQCPEFDCELDHPASRRNKCTGSRNCPNYYCTDLHPVDWDPCEKGSDCKDPDCPCLIHPADRILPNEEKPVDKKESWHQRPQLKTLSKRHAEREEAGLPILTAKDEFCRRLEAERVLVVTAETGSGKSTQLPQYAAEYFGGLVICTQPRVIAAMSLARRVANEYDGTSVGYSVGYRVGHSNVGKDKNRAPGTDILFMTDGTFIQESQNDKLNDIRVLIIDEAHERSLNTDIIMGVVKQLLIARPDDFYVVISSATIDPSRFLEFFDRPDAKPLNVLGRVHEVTPQNIPKPKNESVEKHAVSTLLKFYDKHEGNTLVFLPGQREIETAIELFNHKNKHNNCIALPLYASLTPEEQDLVLQFDEGPQNERRMVVFCTNVAETSLTIKNIRLVIDSGLANEGFFDAKDRLTVLETVRISRASAEQRRGRAGRTARGHCIRLYNDDELIRTNIKPEILRSSLDLVVLQLIRLQLNPEEFSFIDAPDKSLIQLSLDVLKDLGCIDDNHHITPRGQLFAKLGIDPRHSAFFVDTYLEHEPILDLLATITAILLAPATVFTNSGETAEDKKLGQDRLMKKAQQFDSDLFYLAQTYKEWHDTAGIIDPDTRTCRTCRKAYNREPACGPCRAAYSRTHLLNNKTFNYIESMRDDLISTITDSRWQLTPNSLSDDIDESTIIGKNLYKFFPERHGCLILPPEKKKDALMIKSQLDVSISDTSTYYKRNVENPYFIAMSMTKLPWGLIRIDRLHPFSLPNSVNDDETPNK